MVSSNNNVDSIFVSPMSTGLSSLKENMKASNKPSEHPPNQGSKENLNALKPSEHTPDTRIIVKTFWWEQHRNIIGCKDKISSWHLIGFPDSSNIE